MTIHSAEFIVDPDNPDFIYLEKDTGCVFIEALVWTPNTKPEGLRDTQKYKCRSCGWIGTQDDMDKDYISTEGDEEEAWSNWICMGCQTWWSGLDEGYEAVE